MKNDEKHMEAVADFQSHIFKRYLTVPNLICVIRLIGALVLVPIAWQDQHKVFLWLYLFLAMTDWVDGKLAILLNQRSVFGARLDSWADTALYAALFFGLLTMYGDIIRAELVWITVALITYLTSTTAAIWKFQRWPSYHTRAAKTASFLTAVGVISLFSDWSLWPLRIACGAVIITNLEILLIILISPTWHVDVTSIYHAWRDRRDS